MLWSFDSSLEIRFISMLEFQVLRDEVLRPQGAKKKKKKWLKGEVLRICGGYVKNDVL